MFHCTSVLFWFTDRMLALASLWTRWWKQLGRKLIKADINSKGGVKVQPEKSKNLVITELTDKKQIQKIQMAHSVEQPGWSCFVSHRNGPTRPQLIGLLLIMWDKCNQKSASRELQDDQVWKDLPETKKGPIRFLT